MGASKCLVGMQGKLSGKQQMMIAGLNALIMNEVAGEMLNSLDECKEERKTKIVSLLTRSDLNAGHAVPQDATVSPWSVERKMQSDELNSSEELEEGLRAD